MTKTNDNTRSSLQEIHDVFKKYSKNIFKDKIENRDFAMYAKSLRDMSMEELDSECWDSNKNNYDSYMTIPDLICTRLGNEFEQDRDILMVVECKKYIWNVQVDKVTAIFKQLGLELEEAICKIQEQYISYGEAHTVMARSHNTSNKEMDDSLTAFTIAKEEMKRDLFLQELRMEYIKSS